MGKFLMLTLTVLFLLASSGCTDNGTPPEITGLIMDVEGGRILVVKDLEDAGTPYDEWFEAGNRAVWFTVTGNTVIRLSGKKVSPEELAKGQKIQVWAAGPLMESYPEQGEARQIVIMED